MYQIAKDEVCARYSTFVVILNAYMNNNWCMTIYGFIEYETTATVRNERCFFAVSAK